MKYLNRLSRDQCCALFLITYMVVLLGGILLAFR